jgi:hypothetical protein
VPEDFPLIEQQLTLRDCVQSYLEAAAKEKGIQFHVFLDELYLLVLTADGSICSKIGEKVENRQQSTSKNSLPIEHHLSLGVNIFKPYLTMATIHHELGHAKFTEKHPKTSPNLNNSRDKECQYVLHDGPKSNRLSQWIHSFHKRKEQLYKDRFQQEQYADAATPDDKKLLKAAQQDYASAHNALRRLIGSLSVTTAESSEKKRYYDYG